MCEFKMKKNIYPFQLFLIYFILIIPFSLQGNTNKMKSEKNSINSANSTQVSWFSIKKVADKVWCINDHGNDNIYLVEGNEKALLIDDGLGVADLAGFLKSMTNLPLLVVNTHGHPDHTGGNFQFKEVYAHPADFEQIGFFCGKDYHIDEIKRVKKNSPDFASFLIKDLTDYKLPELIPVETGYIFNLGERKLEVIEVPGHTKGSICLLDADNKLLFTGDNNNTMVWLFLQGCLPLETYLKSLKNLETYSEKYNTILPGHGDPLDKNIINELIKCAQNILDGTCKGEKYESFAGDGMICRYKGSSIAYNPDNLFIRP
jgi:hydroxyacylglutathione hydrolase